MTFVVPNYFLEEQPEAVIASDGLFSVAYSTRGDNDRIEVRNTTHVMILILEGSKRLRFADEEMVLGEGSLFFLAQGNYIMSEVLSAKGGYRAVMVYFDDVFVQEFVRTYDIRTEGCEPAEVVRFGAWAHTRELGESFTRYLSYDSAYTAPIVKLKTQELWLYLLGHEKEAFCGFLQALLAKSASRTMHILQDNLDIIESVEQMARLTRLSKPALRKAVYDATGLSPKAWLDAKRLEHAAHLLRYSQESIASVATSCGYASLSWFGVQFKKHYGCTPKVYREQFQSVARSA